jgi:hypothetical protein
MINAQWAGNLLTQVRALNLNLLSEEIEDENENEDET